MDRRNFCPKIIAKLGQACKQCLQVCLIVFGMFRVDFNQFTSDCTCNGGTIGRIHPDMRVEAFMMVVVMLMVVIVIFGMLMFVIMVDMFFMFMLVIGMFFCMFMVMLMLMIFGMFVIVVMLLSVFMCAMVMRMRLPCAAFTHIKHPQTVCGNQFKLMAMTRQAFKRLLKKTFQRMRNIDHQIGITQRTRFAGAKRIGMRRRRTINQQHRLPDILHDGTGDPVYRFDGGHNLRGIVPMCSRSQWGGNKDRGGK